MKFVIDPSIAIKWVVEEAGTIEAVALRRKANLIAPELLVAECANILWKKVQRKELSKEVARIAARLLKGAELELLPMRAILEEPRFLRSISVTSLTIVSIWRLRSLMTAHS